MRKLPELPKIVKAGSKQLALMALCLTGLTSPFPAAVADQPNTTGGAAPTLCVTSRCQEDPACVIVGNTHILEWKSAAAGKKTIVVCVHGLGLCARAYKPLATELSRAGIDGFAVNVRGFGPDRSSPERSKLDCLATIADIRKFLSSIRQDHPDSRIFLLGESMGGALVVRLAAENPDLVDGVICSAPAWKILRVRRTAVHGILELLFFSHQTVGPTGRSVVGQATADPHLTEHLLKDSSHKLKLSLSEAREFLSFIAKTDDYAKKLRKPILVLQGVNDRLVSPTAAAKLFRAVDDTAGKTMIIDGTGEHLLLEEGQFTPALADQLIAFIKDAGTGKGSVVKAVNTEKLSDKQKHKLNRLKMRCAEHQRVKWKGRLSEVHQGIDCSGKIDLTQLASRKHLYAVGPLANFEGEITIIDGSAFISRIADGKPIVENSLAGRAAFLVYGQSAAWQPVTVSKPVSLAELDEFVEQQASAAGIDMERPFPFLVTGTAVTARYHIVHPLPSGPRDQARVHEKALSKFTADNSSIQLVGFFSRRHHGIFTHQGTNMHVHVLVGADKSVGHLEDISLGPAAQLLLPVGYGNGTERSHRSKHIPAPQESSSGTLDSLAPTARFLLPRQRDYNRL